MKKEIRYNILRKICIGKRARNHYRKKWEELYYAEPRVQGRIERLWGRIREKVKKNERVRIYFLCMEKAQWNFQSIYDALEKEKGMFEVCVYVPPQTIRPDRLAQQEMAVQFFRNKGVSVTTVLEKDNLPDIIFVNRHDFAEMGGEISLRELHEKVILCYHAYSYVLSVNSDWYYFEHDNLKYFGKIYTDNEREAEAAAKRFPLKDVVCSGNPQNDQILAANPAEGACYWKSEGKKRIIWAPHWSVGCGCNTSNFDRYYEKMYEYVKGSSEVEMILKPHPYFRKFLADKKSQKEWGVNLDFMTPEQYDEYIERWRQLPNGGVMDSGDYHTLFASSDAMILDSISFIAEYMILGKPQCFCNRYATGEALKSRFNETGRALIDEMTLASTWEDIEAFINTEVIQGVSRNGKHREETVSRYLSVNREHGVGQAIADDLIKTAKMG